MSKSGGTTTSVSATKPPEFMMPYVNQLLQSSQNLYNTGGPQYYPGSTVAGFTPEETQAQNWMGDVARTKLPEVGDWTQQAFAWGIDQARNPASNPYVAQTAEAAVRPVMESLTRTVLPNIRGGARLSGGVGGTRQSLAEANAVDAATRNALDATTNIYNNAYNTGLQTYQNVLGMAPMVQQTATAGPTALSDVGAQQRAMSQAQINEDINRYMWGQMVPYNAITEYANMIKGPWGGQGESTTVAPELGTPAQLMSAGLTLLPLITQLIKLF